MNIRQAYSDWSATYDLDRNLTRDLDQAVTRNILANLHCKSVLELGCGTGKNTALLAEIGERICAIDFSPSMIGKARDKLRLDNVSFEVADITKPWPCESESYDLIVCNLVLEHIRDLSLKRDPHNLNLAVEKGVLGQYTEETSGNEPASLKVATAQTSDQMIHS